MTYLHASENAIDHGPGDAKCVMLALVAPATVPEANDPRFIDEDPADRVGVKLEHSRYFIGRVDWLNGFVRFCW